MDKQKQIEDMAKVRPILENRIDIGFMPDLDKPIAEEIYNAGYRKIPEDENEKLKNCNDKLSQGIYYGNWEQFRNRLEQARKETEREILSAMIKWAYKRYAEIAERYGVEVEE
jgi:hypothetical protein